MVHKNFTPPEAVSRSLNLIVLLSRPIEVTANLVVLILVAGLAGGRARSHKSGVFLYLCTMQMNSG